MPFDGSPRLSRRERDAARGRLAKMRAEAMIGLMCAVIRMAREERIIVTGLNAEGPFRGAIRAALCAQGWRWQQADDVALDLVAVALNILQVKRPSWAEGQQAWTGTLIVRDAECRNCGVALMPRQVHFCCGSCRSTWWAKFNARSE